MMNTTTKPKQMEAYDKYRVMIDGYILHDDEEDWDDEEEKTVVDNPIKDIIRCNFCKTIIEKVGNNTIQEKMHRDFCLWYCHNCRFWQTRLYSAYSACFPQPDNWVYKSKLREFNPNLPNGCDEELALHIRRHPDLVHSFKPTRFEKFVADVFKANYTNAEVTHVGGPKDGGVDVLLIEAGQEQWFIQVKRRGPKKLSEKVSTIRDLLGAMVVEGVRTGVVVSTAERLSPDAQKIVKKAKGRSMNIYFVNKDDFNRMLDPILPYRPWLEPIREVDEEIANYLAEHITSDQQLSLFDSPFRLN